MAPRASHPARSRRVPTQQTEIETGDNDEDFNMKVSGSDSDEELIQHQPRRDRTVPNESVVQQINNPAVREKKTAAHDTKYFFESYGDENVACKECKEVRGLSSISDFLKIVLRILRDADPSKWPPSRRYIYSKNKSTSSLRPHT